MNSTRRRAVLTLLALIAVAVPASAGADAGGLDPSFGDGGFAVVGDPRGNEHVEAAALDSSSRIVASARSGGAIQFTRLLPDGDPDPGFDGDGLVTVDFGEPDEAAYDVATDGNAIVGAGFTGFEGGDSDSYYELRVMRLAPDGDLDDSFGDGGSAVAPFSSYDIAYGVALDGRGRIVAAGRTSHRYGGPSDLAVARFTAHGELDEGFADGGMWRKDLVRGAGKSDDWIDGVIVDGRGRILFAGASGPPNRPEWMVVGRLRPNGELDRRYGDRGIRRVFVSKARQSAGTALSLDRRGRALLVGRTQSSPGSKNEWGVARLTPRGGLDRSFSRDGRRTIGLEGEPADVAAVRDGRIVIAGRSEHPRSFQPVMTAVRLTRTGALDRDFGDRGRRRVLIGSGKSEAAAILTGQAGRYLLVGEALAPRPGGGRRLQADFGAAALRDR